MGDAWAFLCSEEQHQETTNKPAIAQSTAHNEPHFVNKINDQSERKNAQVSLNDCPSAPNRPANLRSDSQHCILNTIWTGRGFVPSENPTRNLIEPLETTKI